MEIENETEIETKRQPSELPLPATRIIEELRDERTRIETLLDQTPRIADQPASLRVRRDALCDEIERLESHGDGGPLITVTLDAYASAIVRRVLRSEADTTEADVANAALTFKWGERDDHGTDEELAAARERRHRADGSTHKEAA